MKKQEYIESVNAAKQHSYEYYVLSRPTISDAQFDALVSRIEQAEQEHPEWTLPDSPTQCVGSDLADNGRRLIRHRTMMLSCQKAQTTDAVEKWLDTTERILNGSGNGYVTEWKMDGISCSLVYQEGRLVSAATRGDKTQGQDILQHVGMMKSVPQHINLYGRVEVRGEIVCPKAELKLLTVAYKDCRSAASGLCNQMMPTIDNGRLVFVAWEVLADYITTEHGAMACAEGMGFICNCRCVKDVKELSDILKDYERERESLEYPTDGVVIKVNSRSASAALGQTEHHPKGSIAYKFAAQTTVTRVRRIEITVGATGRRTPVAWLEPVTILGRKVEKASLGSEAKMQELGVTEGCTVEIGLSNDVTPKIYRVTAAAPAGHVSSPVVEVNTVISPTACPAKPAVAGQPLNIVISGCFTSSAIDGYGRDAAKQFILSAGHKVQSGVCKSTDYMVVGAADVPGRGVGPSKLAQCKSLGIPVVTMSEFKQLVAC